MERGSPDTAPIPMEVDERNQSGESLQRSLTFPYLNYNYCPFAVEGCNETFSTSNIPASHIQGCLYGLFKFCRAEQCRGLAYFTTPQESLEHAVQFHGCIQDPYQENSYIEAPLPHRFLRPSLNSTNAAFAYYYNFFVDNVPMDIALATVARNNQAGNMPTLAIAPIHMSSPWNDHFVQFQITAYQAYNGQVISHVLDNEPIENEESMFSACDELSKSPFIIQAYRSQQQFFRALQNPENNVPRYPVNFVEDGAIEVDGTLTPTINIKIHIDILRCIIERRFVKQPAPYANYWVDLDLPDSVRLFMEGGLSQLTAHNAVIIPQVKKGVDTLIESLDFTECKNAIAVGIISKILSLRGNVLDYSGMRYCYAIIIVPSNHLVNITQELWKTCAGSSNVRFYALQSSFLPTIRSFSKSGADIVITTPDYLSRAMELQHEPFWDILTRRLKCIYLEDPHRLVGSGHFKAFTEALGEKVEEIIKISYAKLIPKNVREALENELYFNGANHFSLGPDPYAYLSDFNPVVIHINENSERAVKTAEMISMHHQDFRWIVWMKEGSTEESIQPLKQALQKEQVDPERITYFFNEQNVMYDGETFFQRYHQQPDGILICTPSAHDFEKASLSGNVVIFDESGFNVNEKDLAVMLSENDNGTFNDIIMFELTEE